MEAVLPGDVIAGAAYRGRGAEKSEPDTDDPGDVLSDRPIASSVLQGEHN
jgi:hypothetical protein